MRVLTAMILAAATATGSVAQEYNWSGIYLGAHIGYGWGEHEGTGLYTDNSGAYKVLDPEAGSIDLEGGFGGGQLGFNVQRGRFVFGVEGDGSWGNIDGENTFISDYDNANATNTGGDGTKDYTWNIKTQVEWMATVRGRLGFLLSPTFLVYGTGGAAWAGVSSDENVTCFPVMCGGTYTTVRASSSETATGWVAGAGAEWAFAPNWSLKGEWQHLDFGDVGTQFVGTAYPDNAPQPKINGYSNDSFPGSLVIDTVRLGVNYKFGGRDDAVPLK